MDKVYESLEAAVLGIHDGATVMIGGFGDTGYPFQLVEALANTDVAGLTLISNNAGHSSAAFLRLIAEGRVSRIVCSFPVRDEPNLARALDSGHLALELVPQGTLAERIRAAGAGIPAFYSPTGVDTELAAGKETRVMRGRRYLLEEALYSDVAFIKATSADSWGNLTYHAASQNFNPVMAMAASLTIVQSDVVVERGDIAPSSVDTPGIFVDRVVEVGRAGRTEVVA